MSEQKTTYLYNFHTSQNAKMIDFGGWSMPFSYDGTLKEHNYVREDTGFFDVSHMGRLRLQQDQMELINSLICSELTSIENTKALYSLFLNENGNALDDVIFWKFEDDLILICNASNTEKITNHLASHSVNFDNLTSDTVLIAVQGKTAIEKLENKFNIPEKFNTGRIDKFTYARTGYTGEDGIEIMCSNDDADELINYLMSIDIKPCGLGSRDTLRLEGSLPLYGFELTEDISPVEAGLKWTITNKSNYLGKEKIDDQINSGNHKYLKRFTLNGRQIARTGTEVLSDNVKGLVTSGNISPVLQVPIGFVLFESKPPVDLVNFDIRGNLLEGNLLKKRFLS